MENRPKQTPLEKLSARLAAAREIIVALKLAVRSIPIHDSHQIWGLITRLTLCNNRGNHWHSPEIYNHDTGECYEGVGQFWQCGSKLCPNCLAKHAQRSRKRLRQAFEHNLLFPGERFYFVTFTMPNPRRSLIATRDIIQDAWQRFRKRKLCVDLVRGGVKSEEFTVTANGYHYHLHLIIRSRFLRYNDVRRIWTECLDAAFTKANVPYAVNTTDGMAIVKIQPLSNREKAIQEVCKYITKSDSWIRVPPSELIAIAMIKKWHRMFELFGTFADRNKRSPILDTRSTSDAESRSENEYWRDVVDRIGAKAYSERLLAEFEATKAIRLEQIRFKWPHAIVTICDSLDV